MSTFARYTHLPLPSSNHIRLLEFPSYTDPNEPLQGTLRVVNLEESDIPYVALSYTWGQRDFSEDLVLDGNTIFGITPTLAAALRRFRYASALRWIWVDAICINQQDDAEKTMQIPLMGNIYRSASRVMVWLGGRAEDVDLLRQIKRLVGKMTEPYEDDATATRLVAALSQLGRLPWFSRRWIIQEIVLNPNAVLCCGPTELPWTHLAPAFRVLERKGMAGLQNIRLLWDLWWDVVMPMGTGNKDPGHEFLGKRDIAALLNSCSAFECCDGHDRIAALMGLSTDAHKNVMLNYADPVEKTFTSFAESLARNGHMAWLIYQSLQRKKDPGSHQGQTLPSWVPDWRDRILIHDQNSKLDTDIYEKVPCNIQMHSGSSSLHLLTADFSVLAEEATGPGDSLQVPVEINPVVLLQVAWKGVLFSKEADLAERITLTLESLWPWVVARLNEDEMAFTHDIWFELLIWISCVLVFPDQSDTYDRILSYFYETKYGRLAAVTDFSQDASGLDTLTFIKDWLRIFSLDQCMHLGIGGEDLARNACLVFYRATSDSGTLTRGQPCAIGSLQLPFYHAVEIGDKVLSADLGQFHSLFRHKPPMTKHFWVPHDTRYIVREHPTVDGVPLLSGIMSSDDLPVADGVSLEGIPRIPKARGSKETPLPMVYEFVAPCVLFGLFPWRWLRSIKPKDDLRFEYSYSEVKTVSKKLSIWIK